MNDDCKPPPEPQVAMLVAVAETHVLNDQISRGIAEPGPVILERYHAVLREPEDKIAAAVSLCEEFRPSPRALEDAVLWDDGSDLDRCSKCARCV
jgi:hypothetical protein